MHARLPITVKEGRKEGNKERKNEGNRKKRECMKKKKKERTRTIKVNFSEISKKRKENLIYYIRH